MGPVAMLRPPPGTSSQTQPDGRSVYSVFALRLGQRGIAPLCARPLGGAGGADLPGPRRRIREAVGGIHHEPGVQQVWAVFGDDQMAAALIDRIVHHGRLVQFRGESYRVRHALMQEG